MIGLFGTLNLASRSLQTQMAGVEVAGQNLANINTPGYSRQRVIIETNPSIPTGVGMEGTGASVQGIEQIVDTLLNGKIQTQASVSGYWDSQQGTLKSAQIALNEYLASGGESGNGLSARINEFFDSLQTLSVSPSSDSARRAVIGAAQTLTETFKQTNLRLSDLQTDLDTSLDSQVSAANQLLTDIAGLNDQIANAENASAGTANELRDLRQQKLESLAKFMNFQSSTAADGTVTITTVNQIMVSGNQVDNALKTVRDATTGELHVWTTNTNNVLTGVSFGLTGGSLEATVDVRDGTLTTLRNNLNNLASTLITQVNSLHSAGFNRAGGTGADFFTGGNAGNISVNTALVADPSLLQASGVAGLDGDGSVALSLAQLASTSLAALNNQTFSGSYAESITELGEALRNANAQATTQAAVTNMLTTQRNSVSGVNLDEEMTNLMMYQRAYQASAHIVSSVDEMIQILLNMKA